MSYADKIFKEMCYDILVNGVSTDGEDVRPKWKDGMPAHTIKKFGIVNTYDLSKEFPIITLRPTAFKSALKEILWIYQLKSSDVSLLEKMGVNYWADWKREDGTIGKAYGYQLGKKHKYSEGEFDQVDRLIFDLKNNPQSRRMIVNLYNHEDLHDMALYPCCFMTIWNVEKDKLNMTLIQRSSDVLTANNINVVQYALLQHMIAQVTGFKVGKLMHVITDCHIYDRHIPMVNELLHREEYKAPTLWINSEIKNFYDFTPDDFKLENYKTSPQIKDIPLAI